MIFNVHLFFAFLFLPYLDGLGQGVSRADTTIVAANTISLHVPQDSIRFHYRLDPVPEPLFTTLTLFSESLHLKPRSYRVSEVTELLLEAIQDAGYPHAEVELWAIRKKDENSDSPISESLNFDSPNSEFSNFEPSIDEKRESITVEYSVVPLSRSSTNALSFTGISSYSESYLQEYLQPVVCQISSKCSDTVLNKDIRKRMISRLTTLDGVKIAHFEGWENELEEKMSGLSNSNTNKKNDTELPIANAKIRLESENIRRLHGIIGLSNHQGTPTWMGEMMLDIPTLSKKGFGLSASLSRHQANQAFASARLKKQMVASLPIDVEMQARYFQQDSLYLESEIMAQFMWNAWQNWSAGSSLKLRNVRVGNSIAQTDLKERTQLLLGYKVSYHPDGVIDFRDEYTPVTGLSAMLQLDHSLGSEKQIHWDSFIQTALPVYQRKWILHMAARAQAVYEKELAYSELIPVGGARDFPGLNPAQLRVKSRIQSDLLLRWHATGNLLFLMYISNGWVVLPEKIPGVVPSGTLRDFENQKKSIHTAGIGFAVETRSGWLELTTAISSINRFDQAQVILRFTPN